MPIPEEPPERYRTVTLEGESVRVASSALGGRLVSVELADYWDRIGEPRGPVQLATDPVFGVMGVRLGDGPLQGLETTPHELVTQSERSVTWRVEKSGIEVTRTLTLDDAGYGARLRVELRNRSTAPVLPRFEVLWYGEERASNAPDRFLAYSLVASVDGDVERMPVQGIGTPGFFSGLFGGGSVPTGEQYPGPLEWAGLDSQYFLAVSVAENPREAAAFLGPRGANAGVASLHYPVFQVPPGTRVERNYRLYLGPKVRSAIAAVDPRVAPAADVGWSFIRPLVDLFAGMLTWTHRNVVPNYGVAIILLTIVLRLATYPLTQRSMKSMKRFTQIIAPQLKELQEKHKDDKAKLQEEMMGLYRQKGMNPVTAMGGGCLPMLIQMPFMIALYFALQGSIALRHAPFALWIDDLSAPENLVEIAGIPVRVLPLLMGASMILQQRMTPTPPTADAQQQKQMMTLMSVMFIFVFYQFPSGLVLYWFVSNLLGIAQQLLVNRQTADATA